VGCRARVNAGHSGLLHGGQVIGGAASSIGMDVDAAVERVQNDPG
jgi:hypothetical protein